MIIVDRAYQFALNFDNVKDFFVEDRKLKLNIGGTVVVAEFHDEIKARLAFKLIVSAYVAGEKIFYLNGRDTP